jgi:predicted nucleotidyltransferase
MDTIRLPDDFKEFLRLLNSSEVEYLLVGGYAVGYYGYLRATADIDLWVAMNEPNARKLVDVLVEFGFDVENLSTNLFLTKNKIIRMGNPPFRIELLTTIDGVTFEECYPEKITDRIDGIDVQIITLEHLKKNKLASGRHKDLDDLENL